MKVKKIKTIGFIALLLTVCSLLIVFNMKNSSNEVVTHVLEQKGYTHVVIGDIYLFCAKNEYSHRKFIAHNSQGLLVSGHICSNAFGHRISEQAINKNTH